MLLKQKNSRSSETSRNLRLFAHARAGPPDQPPRCFTIGRVDARKYGLSRVCLGKRMCLTPREKSPEFAISELACLLRVQNRLFSDLRSTSGLPR
jgi:hypothetical protein